MAHARRAYIGRHGPQRSAYAAAKFAVEGFSLSIAQEVARFGIKVTLVEPGFFRTDLLAPQSSVFGELEVEG